MQGGINNAALFGASQRSARSKLDQMAGIQRPSGILASSSELMQAAMPAQPPMPTAPPPVMQQPPASMVGAPMAPPPMPNMPMPTTVAPRPLNPMANNPVVPQPASPNTPMRFATAGSVDVAPFRPRFQGDVPADAVDITMDKSEFNDVLKKLNPESTKYLLETYGDEAGIAQAAQRKVNNISAAAASKDPAQTADQVMVEAGEQPTDAAKIDFAENVFGLEDVNDIDEINRRIANVAIGSSVAKSPDEFAQAVLLGLQTFKQTASARSAAAAAAAGKKSTSVGGVSQDLIDTYYKMLENNISAVDATTQINEIAPGLGDKVRAVVAASGGATPPPAGGQPTKESLIAEARSVVERGGDREKVAERLKGFGINPEVLN